MKTKLYNCVLRFCKSPKAQEVQEDLLTQARIILSNRFPYDYNIVCECRLPVNKVKRKEAAKQKLRDMLVAEKMLNPKYYIHESHCYVAGIHL